MNLRLPESGSLVESLLGRLGASPNDPASGTVVEHVSEADITAALDALVRADIEFVILEHGDEFLQAAGAGTGPYALQFSPDATGSLQEVPGGVDAETMRSAVMAYGRGEAGWRGGLGWSAA